MSWFRRSKQDHESRDPDVLFCDGRSEVCDAACRAADQRDALMRGLIRAGGTYPRVV